MFGLSKKEKVLSDVDKKFETLMVLFQKSISENEGKSIDYSLKLALKKRAQENNYRKEYCELINKYISMKGCGNSFKCAQAIQTIVQLERGIETLPLEQEMQVLEYIYDKIKREGGITDSDDHLKAALVDSKKMDWTQWTN